MATGEDTHVTPKGPTGPRLYSAGTSHVLLSNWALSATDTRAANGAFGAPLCARGFGSTRPCGGRTIKLFGHRDQLGCVGDAAWDSEGGRPGRLVHSPARSGAGNPSLRRAEGARSSCPSVPLSAPRNRSTMRVSAGGRQPRPLRTDESTRASVDRPPAQGAWTRSKAQKKRVTEIIIF